MVKAGDEGGEPIKILKQVFIQHNSRGSSNDDD